NKEREEHGGKRELPGNIRVGHITIVVITYFDTVSQAAEPPANVCGLNGQCDSVIGESGNRKIEELGNWGIGEPRSRCLLEILRTTILADSRISHGSDHTVTLCGAIGPGTSNASWER